MTTILDSDVYQVSRDGTQYKVTKEDMDLIEDTDLLLVNRDGVNYSITGELFKEEGGGGSGGTAPFISQAVLTQDDEAGPRFTGQDFTTTMTFTPEGVPLSTKGVKPYVMGGITKYGETANIDSVGAAPASPWTLIPNPPDGGWSLFGCDAGGFVVANGPANTYLTWYTSPDGYTWTTQRPLEDNSWPSYLGINKHATNGTWVVGGGCRQAGNPVPRTVRLTYGGTPTRGEQSRNGGGTLGNGLREAVTDGQVILSVSGCSPTQSVINVGGGWQDDKFEFISVDTESNWVDMENGVVGDLSYKVGLASSGAVRVTWSDSSSSYRDWTSNLTVDGAPEFSQAWKSIAYHPTLQRFVAVASGGDGNRVMYSDDGGKTWTLTPSLDDTVGWNCIAFGDGMFAACGQNRIMWSEDGITWAEAVSQTGNWQKLGYASGIDNGDGTFGLWLCGDGGDRMQVAPVASGVTDTTLNLASDQDLTEGYFEIGDTVRMNTDNTVLGVITGIDPDAPSMTITPAEPEQWLPNTYAVNTVERQKLDYIDSDTITSTDGLELSLASGQNVGAFTAGMPVKQDAPVTPVTSAITATTPIVPGQPLTLTFQDLTQFDNLKQGDVLTQSTQATLSTSGLVSSVTAGGNGNGWAQYETFVKTSSEDPKGGEYSIGNPAGMFTDDNTATYVNALYIQTSNRNLAYNVEWTPPTPIENVTLLELEVAQGSGSGGYQWSSYGPVAVNGNYMPADNSLNGENYQWFDLTSLLDGGTTLNSIWIRWFMESTNKEYNMGYVRRIKINGSLLLNVGGTLTFEDATSFESFIPGDTLTNGLGTDTAVISGVDIPTSTLTTSSGTGNFAADTTYNVDIQGSGTVVSTDKITKQVTLTGYSGFAPGTTGTTPEIDGTGNVASSTLLPLPTITMESGRFAVGSKVESVNQVPIPVAKMWCKTSDAGVIYDLTSEEPPYTMIDQNQIQTLTWVDVLPSGNPPDTECPDGTSLVVDVIASNDVGSSAYTTNVVTPA